MEDKKLYIVHLGKLGNVLETVKILKEREDAYIIDKNSLMRITIPKNLLNKVTWKKGIHTGYILSDNENKANMIAANFVKSQLIENIKAAEEFEKSIDRIAEFCKDRKE